MIRVYMVLEGQTEQTFVREVLQPEIGPEAILHPFLIGKPGHKGGNVGYQRAKKDILNLLKGNRGAYCTSMFDFYALGKDFPGFPLNSGLTSEAKAEAIESAMLADICDELGPAFNRSRFIPYIQMHEFEALLFSSPDAFARGVYQPELAGKFRAIRDEFPTPEDINDGATTAPSKRILANFPGYDKVTCGSLAAITIGVSSIQSECPHFSNWIQKLKALAPSNSFENLPKRLGGRIL